MQIKIQLKQWDEVLLHDFAALTSAAWQATGFRDFSPARIETWLSDLKFDIPPVFVKAESSSQGLIGWLLLFTHDSTTVEINPWGLGGHPIVHPNMSSEEIAPLLLRQAIDFAKKEGFSRVDLNFPYDRSDNEQFKALYESYGMTLTDATLVLQCALPPLESSKTSFRQHFVIKPLSAINQEQLFKSWYEIFETGKVRHFLRRTESERAAFFKRMFDFSEPVIEEASLALTSDGPEESIVGFSLVKSTHGDGNGHLWEFGINANYRRKGLGEAFLLLIMEKLAQQDFQSMSVGVDPENRPAYELYRKHGFKEEFGIIEYALQI
ncbi:MAG: GNAT family N-acetyltransferase [Candidatus Heimdallarchaeota archaeon]